MTSPFLSRWLCLLLLAFTAQALHAGGMPLHAQLIWGAEKEQETKLRKLDGDVTEKLKKIFKWQHYYEVTNKNVHALSDKAQRIDMSKKCSIEVQNFEKSGVEVKLFGEGKHIKTVRQVIPAGEMLVLAGDDKNDTAWFVIITAPK